MSADLDRILRWEGLGAPWEVVADDGEVLTIALCRCDSGEEMERFESRAGDVRVWVQAHEPLGP